MTLNKNNEQKNMTAVISNQKIINGNRVKFIWINCEDHKKFAPKTQSYAICFDKQGRILIGRKSKKHTWLLPGGTIERGESPEEALRREAYEEVTVRLGKIKLLGVQRVDYPKNPKKREGKCFYQLRYAAMIHKIENPRPDPDCGMIWERRFIRPDEFLKYLPWGAVGKHISEKAHNQFLKWSKEKIK
jgi:8-oxo-dGTP pyrophosphatase MutT (NUDIX family)